MPDSWRQEGEAQVFGTVSLHLLVREEGSPEPVWDMMRDLRQAKVRRVYKDRTQNCTDYSDSPPTWNCKPRDRWLYVGETMQPVTNDVHRCLWAMPIDKGGWLEIHFDEIPKGRLEVYIGQPLEAIRSSRGEPVSFAIKHGKETLYAKKLGIHEEGWQPISLERAEASPLSFFVHSDNKLDRFFCMAARVVKDGETN